MDIYTFAKEIPLNRQGTLIIKHKLKNCASSLAFDSPFRRKSFSLLKSSLCNSGFPRLSRKIDVPARYSSRSCGPICTGGHPAMRGATESKVSLAPFCLAERQVSPSALRSPPLPSLLVPGRVHCFCCHRASFNALRHTRAQNFALFPYIRVLVRRIYQ